MRDRHGLSHSESCLHHTCRLLASIKSHFQYAEITKQANFVEWIRHLGNFTKDILSSYRSVSTRSTHYIMSLWAALVLPTPYIKLQKEFNGRNQVLDASELELNTLVSQVVNNFISSRCELCATASIELCDDLDIDQDIEDTTGFHGGFGRGFGAIEDDPLADEGMLLEHLAPLPCLIRYKYKTSVELIRDLFNENIQKRENAIQTIAQCHTSGGSGNNLLIARQSLIESQSKLTFLTYIIGAIIGGHISRIAAGAVENLDELNAELAACSFRLILSSQRIEDSMQSLSQNSFLIYSFASDTSWKLELSCLYFFKCFQNFYLETKAREDVAEMEQLRRRSMGLVEDANGFLTFWTGGGRAARSSSMRGISPPSSPVSSSSMKKSSNSQIIAPATFKIGSLVPARTSLKSMVVVSDDTSMTDDNKKSSNNGSIGNAKIIPISSINSTTQRNNTNTGDTSMNDNENTMNDEAVEKTAALQRNVSSILGIQGGDRQLLDIAMHRIFALLRYAQSTEQDTVSKTTTSPSSAPVILVQRALSVLYQLSVGVSIVNAGTCYSPKLVCSGRLLLESEVILDLLSNPSVDRFPLLQQAKHGKARTFYMATLSKLLYTQNRIPPKENENSTLSNQLQILQNNAIINSTLDMKKLMRNEANYSQIAEDRFIRFISSLTKTADDILQVVGINTGPNQNTNTGGGLQIPIINPITLQRDDFKNPIIGLCRDLRGITSSASTSKEYSLISSWLFPKRIAIFIAAANAWCNYDDVCIPLLKLFVEISHNRGNRITFPQQNVGGLLLFREICHVVISYCTSHVLKWHEQLAQELPHQNSNNPMHPTKPNQPPQPPGTGKMSTNNNEENNIELLSMQSLQEELVAMNQDTPSSNNERMKRRMKVQASIIPLSPGAIGKGYTIDLDASKMKISTTLLKIVTRLLNGRYANFGTLKLYNDTCLDDIILLVLQYTLISTPRHIMNFSKTMSALILLLSTLAEKFILSIVDIDSKLFARMMACLGEALYSNKTSLSTPAALAIESIAILRCYAAEYTFNLQSSSTNDQLNRENVLTSLLGNLHRKGPSVYSSEQLSKAMNCFRAHEAAQPKLFGELLSVLLDKLWNNTSDSSKNASNQWSLARPIMPLVLCSPSDFDEYRNNFLAAQSSQMQMVIQEKIDLLFSKLLPATNDPRLFSITLQTNDIFAKELCNFSRQLKT